jgi:hypothetical protein
MSRIKRTNFHTAPLYYLLRGLPDGLGLRNYPEINSDLSISQYPAFPKGRIKEISNYKNIKIADKKCQLNFMTLT